VDPWTELARASRHQKVDAVDVKLDRRFDEIGGQLSEVPGLPNPPPAHRYWRANRPPGPNPQVAPAGTQRSAPLLAYAHRRNAH
jgi:hypothetical protein